MSGTGKRSGNGNTGRRKRSRSRSRSPSRERSRTPSETPSMSVSTPSLGTPPRKRSRSESPPRTPQDQIQKDPFKQLQNECDMFNIVMKQHLGQFCPKGEVWMETSNKSPNIKKEREAAINRLRRERINELRAGLGARARAIASRRKLFDGDEESDDE